MASWKWHVLGGFVISIIFFFLATKVFDFDLTISLSAVPVILLYSILPDIDNELSKITWIVITASGLMILWGFLATKFNFLVPLTPANLLLYGLILLLSTIVLAHFTKHRGFVHSIAMALISPALLFIFGIGWEQFALFAFASVSFWSHLLMDKIPFKLF